MGELIGAIIGGIVGILGFLTEILMWIFTEVIMRVGEKIHYKIQGLLYENRKTPEEIKGSTFYNFLFGISSISILIVILWLLIIFWPS
ncbi:hypothetical protein [Wohlfahrtiimonas populi]|uniref:hypothetical protein n=1 Tax=Wohlfahrtiimonas populi TaxID=1940240 RepID=UPI00098D51AA|nr:hypothetical protein [Wohlfahrtiimonas populi]